MVNGEAGKGDSYRRVDQKKWDESYERIYGKKKQCPRCGNTCYCGAETGLCPEHKDGV